MINIHVGVFLLFAGGTLGARLASFIAPAPPPSRMLRLSFARRIALLEKPPRGSRSPASRLAGQARGLHRPVASRRGGVRLLSSSSPGEGGAAATSHDRSSSLPLEGEDLIIIDGSRLLIRAFYATAHRQSGSPSSLFRGPMAPVLSFCTFVNARLLKKGGAEAEAAEGPGPRAIVVFDSVRRERFTPPDEEATPSREPFTDDLRMQFRVAQEACEAYGLPFLATDEEGPGWHGEDIIATLAAEAEAQGARRVVVVSDDHKHLAQIVTATVRLQQPHFGAPLIGPGEVFSKWGVHPEQMSDLLALVGDPASGIPGVAGIGKVNAARLVHKYDSVDAVPPLKLTKKLAPLGENETKRLVKLWKNAITLRQNLELQDEASLLSFLERYGLEDLQIKTRGLLSSLRHEAQS